jgi:cyclopropane fatty-acyl-phospholipid synthase-like methyltransferase
MDHIQKQFSAACERNREPILLELKHILRDSTRVLEIGSGTGQHAVHFARHLTHLDWYPSDREQNHPSILAWINEADLPNIKKPLVLDVTHHEQWPTQKFDAAFTANTCHIMAWTEVEIMFAALDRCLEVDAVFVIYGPFNYDGKFTSASNEAFHQNLQSQAPHMGIRNIEALNALAASVHFECINDIAMPANNRLLVFKKTTKT